MKKIKFGILGCGMIANVHAAAIKGIDEAELVGVADAKLSAALSFAERHGVTAYESYEEMLASDIDVICICTPSGHHAQNAKDAMTAGKHVVIEKPIALTLDDADMLIDIKNKTGKLLTVISQLRFSPDVSRVKKLIEAGAFGKITICNLFMNYYRSREYYSSSAWKGTRSFDGGVLMNQGIHGIDLMVYIMGGISEASSRAETFSHNIETEDTIVSSVKFECGAVGTIEASTCTYPGFDRRIEIYGDKGYVFMRENVIEQMMTDGEKKEVAPTNTISTSKDPASLDEKMHRAQIMNMIDAITKGTELFVTAEDGRKAVETIKTIYGK